MSKVEDLSRADLDRLEEIKKHIREISSLLEIPVTDSNKDTPYRVAKMLMCEMFENRGKRNYAKLNQQMRVFEAPNHYTKGSNPIVMRDMPFNSVCEHHWLPFMGTVTVTYIPDKHIIGLSKIPRIVKYFSKKPQLQEQLTNDIGEYLFDLVKPQYIKVEMKAIHTCVMCRGIESPAQTETVFERGSLE